MREISDEEYEQYEKELNQRTGIGCLVMILGGIVIFLAWILSSLF